ncbi:MULTISPECIES: transposase [Bacillaceae]|uniref:Transposase n=1 Tax=Evansella alkalicola TaxID=745819 RepID=A0ABS6JX57_9BACI|nr:MULTISPECIES: transposase [Bacillaceae]MBU9723154.1 transposase [Bacillus alkalicola]
MPREARKKSKTLIYHIMWRGANGQEIFHDDEDRMVFLDNVMKYKRRIGLKVYAWCLMSNHVHLLMKEGEESISITMKRIGVCFVSHYNWKYRTRGHLFQDRFRSENVETDQYMRTVVRYIHQNPVKAKIVDDVQQWKWSSCNGYYGKKIYPLKLLDQDFVLGMFSDDRPLAMELFKDFNERSNHDECLDDHHYVRRLSDEEVRIEIKRILGTMEIAHVKTLSKVHRTPILRKIKKIDGISQKQAARILGISVNLVYKA